MSKILKFFGYLITFTIINVILLIISVALFDFNDSSNPINEIGGPFSWIVLVSFLASPFISFALARKGEPKQAKNNVDNSNLMAFASIILIIVIIVVLYFMFK